MNTSFSDSKMSGLGLRLCTNASNLLKFKELESDLISRKIIKKVLQAFSSKINDFVD